ncbi:MAG: O-antigen ligase family protein [Candidatus Pacebacteria bacterium]|nr:O-antigen ligase family protein [Candidatus Paceibacterota bacterium]
MDNIILIIFFLIFTAISLRNIKYGIYAVIFSMPLYLVRFSIEGIPTTALEIMIYILFFVWIFFEVHSLFLCHFEPVRVRNLRMLLCKKNVHIKTALRYLNHFAHFKMIKREDFLNILNIGIVLLFLGLTISTFNSIDLRTSLGIFKGWFVSPFLFFIVFVSVIKKEKHINLVLISLVLSGVVVSLISIFYLLNNELTFDGRLKAFFLSPNHLAMYLSPVLLILLFLLLNIKKVSSIKYQVSSVVILTIISIPLFFTYSYGAFLGIFVGVVYLLLMGNKSLFILRDFSRRLQSFSFTSFQSDWRLKSPNPRLKPGRIQILKFLRKRLLIIIFFSFISISFVFISSNKFDQVIDSENRSSFHSRLMIYNASKEIIKDNPFLGIGPGTFQETYLSYAEEFDEPYLEWAVSQPHNIFLAFYLQTGLIGFIGFILILIWFFKYNRCRNEALPRSYGVVTALMIYILVHGLVDTTYWKNDLALIFWIIIGMAVINPALDKN